MPKKRYTSLARFWRRWIVKISGSKKHIESNKHQLKAREKNKPHSVKYSIDTKKQVEDDLNEFENNLREIAKARPLITAGKLQLLNIEPISRKLGARWPKIAERSHLKIENVFGKYLGRRDIFRRHKEFLYVVFFAEIGGEEAKALMSMIGAEIKRILNDGDSELR
ncbi:MAG: hypothetical protein RLN96_12980 [Pseudomonadales bacterium]